ncbi:MAG TPA: toll/interleukin-1 receptor domain-containing protein [Steroidobacteraceae bacterium]|nr:toll/interleukin-1 receptor domain-containing protein [Steroidobacteraceae bacterium]
MAAPKYRAFISYSHRDSRWASWLHATLESYRPPKPLLGTITERGPVPKRLTPIFRDRDELPSAVDLGALVNAALEDSACQIVICSPNSAKSRWVNEEILAFKRLGREDRIFSLIVAGEPNATDMPGRELEECFPPALRFKLGADGGIGELRTEPIAADARPGKDGKYRAALKLVAGLLGVGFDTLRQREQQRRNRRLVAFSCVAMAGMVITSGLAAFAVVQRDRAQRETVIAKTEARTAQETTRFLVDLFKVSDPSEARGNTVTAREMLDKGAARVQGELAREPVIQARLMDTLGTVYMGLGLYPQARPLLDQAVATRRRLPGVDSLELSDSLSHQGSVMWRQADYAAGEKAYREAIRLDAARPTERQAQIELATSLYGLGTLLASEGRYAQAQKNLRAALRLQQDVFGSSDPAIARTMKDLARAVADGGDLNGAIPLMRRAVAMQRALYHDQPHPDLAEVLNDMGLLLDERGDLDESEKFYRESLAMYRRLLGDKHPYVATAIENVALILQDKGDLAGAEALFMQSLQMRGELVGKSHPDYALTLFNVALLQYDRGETEQAFANIRQVLAIYRKAYSADQPETARVLNTLGFWSTMAGDTGEADRYLEEALAMRRRLFDAHHPDVASSLMMLAILRVSEQRYPEALQLAQNAKSIYSAALSPDHWRTAIAESAEGAALTGLGRYAEAQTDLTHSYSILSKDGEAPLVYRTLAQHYLESLHRRERHGGEELSRSAAAAAAPAKIAVASAQEKGGAIKPMR